MAIACAAIDDVSAWCILAGVTLSTHAGGGSALVFALVGTVIYLAFMFGIARPALSAVARRIDPESQACSRSSCCSRSPRRG
ncbi:MAG: hypothetical protein ACREPM_15380 [Gemmatimonadaceae bacterium]